MNRVTLLAILGVAFLIGCGDSDKEPSTRDYRDQFAVTVPAYFEVSSFDVEASENVGSAVEPAFQARFKATVKLKTDTYEATGQEQDAVFIRHIAKAGEQRDLYGIAGAVLYGGNWKVQFKLENNPTVQMGRPRDFFAGRVILVGSEEESEFRAEAERARLAAVGAERVRQLEEEKQQAELARIRHEAQLEQQRRNAELERRSREAQLERERAAAEERRKREEERRRLVRSAVSTGQAYVGEATRSGFAPEGPQRFKIRFGSFDASTGQFTAEQEFPALGSVVKLEGALLGTNLTFKTTGVAKQDARERLLEMRGCVYELALAEANRLEGTFNCRNAVGTRGFLLPHRGKAWIDIGSEG